MAGQQQQQRQEQPGAAFFTRSLARAEAVPPAQRPPEVAAFMDPSQIARRIFEQLLLAADGGPAPPVESSEEACGWCCCWQADHMCPFLVVSHVPFAAHMCAYFTPFQAAMQREGVAIDGPPRRRRRCNHRRHHTAWLQNGSTASPSLTHSWCSRHMHQLWPRSAGAAALLSLPHVEVCQHRHWPAQKRECQGAPRESWA